MTDPMAPGVLLSGVSRFYRTPAETVRAVDDVSLRLARSAVTALVGPSGSGKTTLLNLIAGWESPDEGSIALAAAPGGGWQQLAIVPQSLGLLEELTVRRNIELPLRLGNPRRYDPDVLVRYFGLGDVADRLPAETSLGEQQRAAVARAAICQPVILIADEPTAHQDERNADRVMRALARAAEGGACVVVATHEERMLDRVDRVVEMIDGRLLASDRA